MTGRPGAAPPATMAARAALAQRLRCVADVLVPGGAPAPASDPSQDAAVLLLRLVDVLRAAPSADRVWLVLVALAAALPEDADVRGAVRVLELEEGDEAANWLLRNTLSVAASAGSGDREMSILVDAVVVDVDHSAKHAIHTGIQQVVRSTLPLWLRDHQVHPVVWLPTFGAFRAATALERDRAAGVPVAAVTTSDDQPGSPLVVPWRSTVVLAEVPAYAACSRLAALAQHSGNRLVAIGYDCIPVVSADLVPIEEPNRFARYLTLIKHAEAVAGISVSATAEFSGFTEMLSAQGLTGPTVCECQLPNEGLGVGDRSAVPARADGPPLVLSVGSFEPRKNHLALLHAAERLWREGLSFRLLLVGGSAYGDEVPRTVRRLQQAGRPLEKRRGIPREDLVAAYQEARFTVFTSLHEGYGLPVAESLAFGTPVVTADFGSTREIGAGAGTVLVNPRDDEAIVVAMRRLLTDDAHLLELRRSTGSIPQRSWQAYADELWQLLVTRTGDAA